MTEKTKITIVKNLLADQKCERCQYYGLDMIREYCELRVNWKEKPGIEVARVPKRRTCKDWKSDD